MSTQLNITKKVMDVEWLEVEEITLDDDELTPAEQAELENWTAQNCATTEEF